MAGSRFVNAVGPSAWLPDRKTAVQRSVNLFLRQTESLGEEPTLVLESAPGLLEVNDFGADVRGIINADGRFFVVAGEYLYEMLQDETITNLGTVGNEQEFASMAHGEGQLAIVQGGTLHVLNMAANTITAVASAGWLGSQTVQFIDGYMVFVEPDTERFYISAIDDATSLDALDFSSADVQPDDIVTQIVVRRELFLLGRRSTEVWINSGAVDFPLARYQGTPIDVGCVGPRAVCNADDTVIWIGATNRGGPYVYALNGYQPTRISKRAVEEQLLASTDITQARCWAYQDAGAEFVGVWAPGMSTTWVWDAATKEWHERGELDGGEWTNSRIEHVTYFNNVIYAAGGTKLYRMSRDYYDLAGDALVRERTWPHLISPALEPLTVRELEVRCDTGSTTAGSMTLEISNDGGYVYGPPLQRSLGAVGRRNQRVRWSMLGTCPAGGSRVHRLRCSDAVPLTIHGANIS